MEYKILITGTMGAGKTTAIGQVSEIPPVLTDVANTRRDQSDKATTTAAFDYGELDIGEGDTLRLYGTPGQERFSFMWQVLARGALGVIYLMDCSREEPLADLGGFIEGLGETARQLPSVVALNKLSPEDEVQLAEVFQDYLELDGLDWPVVPADVRDREQVLDAFELLLSMSETSAVENTG